MARWCGVVCLVLLAVAMVSAGREVATDAWAAMAVVSATEWLGLVALWMLWTALRAAVQRWSLPAVAPRAALLMSEAGEAANWFPASSLGSFAVRTSLGRAHGLATGSLVMAFVLVSEALATGLWLLVGAAALYDLQRGSADSWDRAGLIGAAVGVGITVLGAWVIVSTHRATDRFVRALVRVQGRVARRWQRAATVDLTRAIDDARTATAALLRKRGVALVVAGAAVHVVAGTIFWLALRSLGAPVDWVPTLALYLPVKAAIGFSPTPGGVGFAEAGLVGVLVSAGVALDQAVAAVAIYRLFTAFAPLLTGSAVGVWWLRRSAGEAASS